MLESAHHVRATSKHGKKARTAASDAYVYGMSSSHERRKGRGELRQLITEAQTRLSLAWNTFFHSRIDSRWGGYFRIVNAASKSRRLEEEKERKLQTDPDNLKCVTRLEEGNYGGLVRRAGDIPGVVEGSVNQYAWGTGFNPKFGVGVIIHSTGSPGALTGRYSLPTITLRDADSNIIFEGVLKSPLDPSFPQELFNVGLRSAAVLNVEETAVGTIVTVIGSSVFTPQGEFLEFKLNLKDFVENDFEPIFGLQPTRRFSFESPSVRALKQISDSLILFAPNFDVAPSTSDFAFLRFFDIKEWKVIGPRIFLEQDNVTSGEARLEGIVWDFEASLEENGLVFINTINLIDPNPEVTLDEQTIPTTAYFSFDSIPTGSVGLSTNAEVRIPVRVVTNTFDIAYSAQAFEPISAASSVVCTLSGFLFRLGGSRGEDTTRDPAVIRTLRDFQSVLDLFELGNPQQCEVCTGALPEEERKRGRKNRKLQTTRRRSGKGRSDEEDDDDDDDDDDDVKEEKEKVEKVKEKKSKEQKEDRQSEGKLVADTCLAIDVVDQPSTTAYVWAVEECGGKVFVGTYDIASVLGEILLDIFVGVSARFACRSVLTVALACTLTRDCNFDIEFNRDICEGFVREAVNDALPPEVRVFTATGLASTIFEERVTPNGIGFDLYYAEVDDILDGKAEFIPITQNGFRELAPPLFERDPEFKARFGFEPSSQNDEAIRNMSCQKSPNGDTLIVGSAVFRTDRVSNTFEVDTDCIKG